MKVTVPTITLVVAGLSLCLLAGSDGPQRSNHLAASSSPYLKRAAQQPVDWYPWGPEAWERAKQFDRPVLLDLGAVWCGWCDLMDRESYNRPDLAAFINANFVAVKVDYDAQPQLAAELERAQAVLNQPDRPAAYRFCDPRCQALLRWLLFSPPGQG
jgi:thiol:disulfide interchange protein